MSIGKDVILLRSRIAERKRRIRENELRADSHIRTLREIIDVYGDFTEFDMEKAMVIMSDFYALWQNTRELKEEKVRLEKELDG